MITRFALPLLGGWLTKRQICREDVGEDHCFEIITKSRIYYLVAKSHAEMLEWVDVLQSHTILHSENELIEQAEEAIAANTQRKALEEQRKYIAHYMKHRPVATKRKSVQPLDMPVPLGQAPAPPTGAKAGAGEDSSSQAQATASGGDQAADASPRQFFSSSKGTSRAEGLRLPSIGSYRHLLTQASDGADEDAARESGAEQSVDGGDEESLGKEESAEQEEATVSLADGLANEVAISSSTVEEEVVEKEDAKEMGVANEESMGEKQEEKETAEEEETAEEKESEKEQEREEQEREGGQDCSEASEEPDEGVETGDCLQATATEVTTVEETATGDDGTEAANDGPRRLPVKHTSR